jgi:hypothetical protein
MESYEYAIFPRWCQSMKRIEQFVDSHPILIHLSDQPLPDTECLLTVRRAESKMVGKIHATRWISFNSETWLSTDEIQFLFAYLLRNQICNRSFHVIPPFITQSVADLYDVFPQNVHETATDKEKEQYNHAIELIQKYVNSWLNIFSTNFWCMSTMQATLIGFLLS